MLFNKLHCGKAHYTRVLPSIVNFCKYLSKNPKVFKNYAVIHGTKRKIEKGVFEMTDSIGRIFGGNGYGVGGYVPQRKHNVEKEAQPAVPQQERKEVNPDDVLAFLASSTPVSKAPAAKEVQPEVADRVRDAISKFETIAKVVEEEFGQDNVSTIMELMMAKEFDFS